MGYTEEELDNMREKLKQLEDMYQFQLEMGEDTNIVARKIAELKRILDRN